MYKGVLTISKDQGNVAVLFCDICEFDKIVICEKKKLIYLLDSIFRSFDKMCFNFKVQKIETVGKTYMVCAGLREYEHDNLINQNTSENSISRILGIAIEMMRYAKQYKWGDSLKDVELKIGIHYGPVHAGVIGFHKPQFSLIGDTVNTTSRVCSTGQSGKIIISEVAYLQLNEKYTEKFKFIPIIVEAKGKGSLTTYQLEMKIRSDDHLAFNKNLSSSSPKHSLFMSPLNKRKSKTSSNLGMDFSVVVKNLGVLEKKSSLPELKLNFERQMTDVKFDENKEKKNNFHLNTSMKNLIIEEENEPVGEFSPLENRSKKNNYYQPFGFPLNDLNNEENNSLNTLKNMNDDEKNTENRYEEPKYNNIHRNLNDSIEYENKNLQNHQKLFLSSIFQNKNLLNLELNKNKNFQNTIQNMQEINKLDSSFISVPLEKGKHELKKIFSYPSLKKEFNFKQIFKNIFEMLVQFRCSPHDSHKKNSKLALKYHLKSLENISHSKKRVSQRRFNSCSIEWRDNLKNEDQNPVEILYFSNNSIELSNEKKLNNLKNDETVIEKINNEEIVIEKPEVSSKIINIIPLEKKPETLLIPNFKFSFEESYDKKLKDENVFLHSDKIIQDKKQLKIKSEDEPEKKLSWNSKNLQSPKENYMKIETNILNKVKSKKSFDCLHSLENLENEEIEEFYECVEKKPQIKNQTGVIRKVRREKTAFNSLKQENNEAVYLKEHKLWLSFPKTEKELVEDFLNKRIENNQKNDKVIITSICVFLFILSFLKFFLRERYLYLKTLSALSLSSIVLAVIIICFSKKLKKIYNSLILFYFAAFVSVLVVSDGFNSKNEVLIPRLTLLLIYYGLSQLSFLSFKDVICLSGTYLTLSLTLISLSTYERDYILLSTNIFFIIWNLEMIYFKNKMEIDFFNKNKVIEFEKKRLNDIIQYLLPPHVIFLFLFNF